MGAREDLLSAAKRLRAEGQTVFSPAQLIAEARRRGCAYPDTTLRTHITGPMCQNSPDHHAVQYGDLVRVARGQYRLASASVSLASAASAGTSNPRSAPVVSRSGTAPTPVLQTPVDWRWEGNVQAAVVEHLVAEGWRIRRVADTASREQGTDIEAVREPLEVLVEVKGYPSDTYLRGPRAGQRKSASAPLQARHYFADALLTGTLLRSERHKAVVVLAFPDATTYRTLAERTVRARYTNAVSVWFVHEDGRVEVEPSPY